MHNNGVKPLENTEGRRSLEKGVMDLLNGRKDERHKTTDRAGMTPETRSARLRSKPKAWRKSRELNG